MMKVSFMLKFCFSVKVIASYVKINKEILVSFVQANSITMLKYPNFPCNLRDILP